MLRPDEVGDVPEDAADGRPGDVDDLSSLRTDPRAFPGFL